jgi:hypothetical protein
MLLCTGIYWWFGFVDSKIVGGYLSTIHKWNWQISESGPAIYQLYILLPTSSERSAKDAEMVHRFKYPQELHNVTDPAKDDCV